MFVRHYFRVLHEFELLDGSGSILIVSFSISLLWWCTSIDGNVLENPLEWWKCWNFPINGVNLCEFYFWWLDSHRLWRHSRKSWKIERFFPWQFKRKTFFFFTIISIPNLIDSFRWIILMEFFNLLWNIPSVIRKKPIGFPFWTNDDESIPKNIFIRPIIMMKQFIWTPLFEFN